VDLEQNQQTNTRKGSGEEVTHQPDVPQDQVRTSGQVHVYDRPDRSPKARHNVYTIVITALVLLLLLVLAIQLLH